MIAGLPLTAWALLLAIVLTPTTLLYLYLSAQRKNQRLRRNASTADDRSRGS